KVGILRTRGGPCSLDEGCFQPAPAARSGRQGLTCTLVQPRRQSRPRKQMTGGREATHVVSDLGNDDPGDPFTHARDRDQELDGGTKGLDRLADTILDLAHSLLQCVPLGKVQLDHETVMACDPTMQGSEELCPGSLQSFRQVGQPFGIAFAAHQRFEHRTTAAAHEVTEDGGELQVGILKQLLDSLRVATLLMDELGTGTGQITQLLDGGEWNEAATNQAMGEQFGQPCSVVDVALATGEVTYVHGIGQHQLEVPFENVPDRLPVNPGRFHHHMSTPVAAEPIQQVEQALGRCREAAYLVRGFASGSGDSHAGNHDLQMHVQAGAPLMVKFHLLPLRASAWSLRDRNLGIALAARRRAVRTLGCSSGSGSNCVSGSFRTKKRPTSAPTHSELYPVSFLGVAARLCRNCVEKAKRGA